MVSGRCASELELREKIWSLRQLLTESGQPRSFSSIAAELGIPKSSAMYKFHAYEGTLKKRLKKQTALCAARAVNEGSLLEFTPGLGSALSEADYFLSRLKLDFGLVEEAGARAAIASVAAKFIKFKGEGEVASNVVTINEIINVLVEVLGDESERTRKRILRAVYERLGESVAAFWRAPASGSG